MIELGTAFRSAMRLAAAQLLRDYAEFAEIKVQVYPARPRTIVPPTGFVDKIRESLLERGPTSIQRTPTVDIVLLHGLFDSKDAAEQGDAFIDGFIEWVRTRYHEAGPNTLVAIREIEDDPNYIPDWQPESEQRSYYATLIRLEGFAGI